MPRPVFMIVVPSRELGVQVFMRTVMYIAM